MIRNEEDWSRCLEILPAEPFEAVEESKQIQYKPAQEGVRAYFIGLGAHSWDRSVRVLNDDPLFDFKADFSRLKDSSLQEREG